MLQRSFQYMKGTLRIAVLGPYPERFLNLCASERIDVWSLTPVEPGRFDATIYSSDFVRIHAFSARTGCRAKILKKNGVYFTSKRVKKRYGLLAGALAFFIMCVSFSNFVWTFEVTGCETISPSRVLAALEAEGIAPGVRADKIHPEQLRNRILLQLDELSWLTVTVQGSHAVVDVRERIEKPEIIPLNEPCDVVASQSGLVTMMLAKEGQPMKKKGDLVIKGDLLISHSVPVTNTEEVRTVHAMGEVYARVWRTVSAVTPLSVNEKRYTDRSFERWGIIFGTNRINFSINSGNLYEKYDKIINRYELRVGETVLPIALVRETYKEYECVQGTLDQERVTLCGETVANTMIDELSRGAKTTLLSCDTTVDNGVLVTKMIKECTIQIGETVPLG